MHLDKNEAFATKKAKRFRLAVISMVRGMGFEPTRVAPYAPQTYASTNSATPAARGIIRKFPRRCKQYLCEFWEEGTSHREVDE